MYSVLIVEDDENINELLRETLTKEGYQWYTGIFRYRSKNDIVYESI